MMLQGSGLDNCSPLTWKTPAPAVHVAPDQIFDLSPFRMAHRQQYIQAGQRMAAHGQLGGWCKALQPAARRAGTPPGVCEYGRMTPWTFSGPGASHACSARPRPALNTTSGAHLAGRRSDALRAEPTWEYSRSLSGRTGYVCDEVAEQIRIGPCDGTLDELRISDIVRYDDHFTPAQTPFASDEHTLALFHFDGNATGECGVEGATIETER